MYMTYNDIILCVCISWFLAINVTLTATPTINENAGVLKVDLSLDRPSPCCLRVHVEAVDKDAEGKLHALCVSMHACMCVCMCMYMSTQSGLVMHK